MLPGPGATLLVDLDGTVADQLPRVCAYLAAEYGLEVTPDQIDAWSWPVPDPAPYAHIGEVIDELMRERPEWFLGSLAPIPGAVEGLAALSAAGYGIHIATHRLPTTHDVSERWLEANGIVYDRFLRDVPANKGALDGDVLLDDYHGNIADALAAGKAGVLVRQPYSNPAACQPAPSAESWAEIRDLFGV
ncbi:5' nucleotidase, NT5C type [Halosegnis sp.]|uniref:5' nucleotidase, NT5C type n=1 Tax=Halosegnis sp. TaxID=2864959 RepID=UPI0035D418A7